MAAASDIGAMLLSRMGKAGPAAPDAPDAGGGDVDPLGDALSELAQAMQSGDVEGMKTAFRTAVQACEMEPGDDGAAAEPG